MSLSQLSAVALQLVLGAILLMLGAWGRHSAARLVPPTASPDQREHLEESYRRGGWAASIVGIVLIAAGVVAAGVAIS